MEKLVIKADRATPEVVLDPQKNYLAIRGDSFPENAALFYQPVFNWLEQYLPQATGSNIIYELNLVYFNSSSSRVLSDIFCLLEKHCQNQQTVNVHWWYHPDNDMSLEYAEEFREEHPKLEFQIRVLDES